MKTRKYRRRSTRKSSKLRGGGQANVQFVRKGTYGCTFRPPFDCADNSQPGRVGYVSKLMSTDKANEEFNIGQPVININQTQEFTLPPVHRCKIKPTSIVDDYGVRMQSIQNCRTGTDPLKGTRTANADLLFYKDGGKDLERIAFYKHQLRPFFRGLQNLFDGLARLHAGGYVHLDIKPPNITVELSGPAAGAEVITPRFIDFGLGSPIKDWLKHLTAPPEKSFPAWAVYIYWPPELHFLQKGALFDTLRYYKEVNLGAGRYRAMTTDEKLTSMMNMMKGPMQQDKKKLSNSTFATSTRGLYDAAGQFILNIKAARDFLYNQPFAYLLDNRNPNSPGARAFKQWVGEANAEAARTWFAQFDARAPSAEDLNFDAPDAQKQAVLEVIGKILKGVDMWSMGVVLGYCLKEFLRFTPIRRGDGSLTYSLIDIQLKAPVAPTPFSDEFFREAILPANELVERLATLDYTVRLTAEQARVEYVRVNGLLATYMKRPEFDAFITHINGHRYPHPGVSTPGTPVKAAHAIPLPPSPSPYELNYGGAENYGEEVGNLFTNAPAGFRVARIARGNEENFGQNIGGLFENAPAAPPGAPFPVRPGAAPAPMGARPPLGPRRSGRRKLLPGGILSL
jgi:serine/threonine protein kinase